MSIPVVVALKGPEKVKEYISLQEQSSNFFKQKEALIEEFKYTKQIANKNSFYLLGEDEFNIQVYLDIITLHNETKKIKKQSSDINLKIRELLKKEEEVNESTN
ncbi:hypothetical protein M670_00168 [Schinkia azotoformans MEV2011]|uniref:Uncharacterized protein n=1 Tax=Schinkia azotoformans MEV2011 TaxID=1348973 RepID=A0A072NSG2_SCHAZ|nr:hypothetical protein [Schinkia azotoformans]KEF40152.1 hypothetical protein M670_00168 [Schinkia azotoformans MEV2011]